MQNTALQVQVESACPAVGPFGLGLYQSDGLDVTTASKCGMNEPDDVDYSLARFHVEELTAPV